LQDAELHEFVPNGSDKDKYSLLWEHRKVMEKAFQQGACEYFEPRCVAYVRALRGDHTTAAVVV
jgi:hypothetical protein